MRRLDRRSIQIFRFLLPVVVLIIGWILSYRTFYGISVYSQNGHKILHIASYLGSIHVSNVTRSQSRGESGLHFSQFAIAKNATWESWYANPHFLVRVAGLAVESRHHATTEAFTGRVSGNIDTWGIIVPYWLLVALFLLMSLRTRRPKRKCAILTFDQRDERTQRSDDRERAD